MTHQRTSDRWQVLVVGAGNAGLCAGIAASQAGARGVAVVDSAPRRLRGGNSALTKSMRFAWDDRAFVGTLLRDQDRHRLDQILAGWSGYGEEQYLHDWLGVSGERVDRPLIESIIRRSNGATAWMRDHGQRWAPRPNPLPGDVPVVFEGGGQGMQARNFAEFERLGGTVHHDTTVTHIERDAHGGYLVQGAGEALPLHCDALVLASGGFEGNPRKRERHLGDRWRDVKLRGVPFNDGAPLEAALALGADTAGNWTKCHATPQGIGLPDHVLPGEMHRSHGLARYAHTLGIVVNRDGRRFFDEAAGLSNLTYVSLGQKIMDQPGKIAFQIFDRRVLDTGSLPAGYLSDPAAVTVGSLDEGARRFGIDAERLTAEVDRLNAAPNGAARTHGRLDSPPYLFVPVVSGLTFTYGGLSVTPNAEVRGGGEPIEGLYAAGVIVGGLYDEGYPAGTGLMAGAVLGRAAGSTAAAHALRAGRSA
ncbi:FAD-binding protein [Actinomadura pelletieri]|uniref:FAD-binding protein n=1 Tax=Actinomadura pelletieri TaxID=111805 RepID=UPI000EAE1C3E|nr:FAD-binding protein [Actinomadura pelletieri]